ncbi:YheC/D like ATP-grasp [uncultured archaeon]|nr:YheC/D like ATP-grasp [uncultured archaeon]
MKVRIGVLDRSQQEKGMVGRLDGGEADFGVADSYYRKLAAAARNADAEVAVISPMELDVRAGKAQGYVLDDEGKWRRRELDLPDVFYDRMTGGRHPNPVVRSTLMAVERELAERRPFVNPLPLRELSWDKLRVYSFLAGIGLGSEGDVRVAETLPFSLDAVGDLMDKYGSVVLKPRFGQRGVGVAGIRRTDEGFEVRYRRESWRFSQDRLGEAVEHAMNVSAVEGEEYIVQQAIDVATVDGRTPDVRVLYQRDGEGRVNVLAAFGRLGAEGKIVSNAARGGDEVVLDRVLDAFGDDAFLRAKASGNVFLGANMVVDEIQTLLGSFGQVAVDGLLDKQGNFYVNEITAVPFVGLSLGGRDLGGIAAEQVVGFALRISGRKQE